MNEESAVEMLSQAVLPAVSMTSSEHREFTRRLTAAVGPVLDAAVNAALDRVVRRIEVGDAGLTWHHDKAQVVRIVNETRPGDMARGGYIEGPGGDVPVMFDPTRETVITAEQARAALPDFSGAPDEGIPTPTAAEFKGIRARVAAQRTLRGLTSAGAVALTVDGVAYVKQADLIDAVDRMDQA